MSKQIKGITPQGEGWWLLCPNVILHSFATNPKKNNFLEIFYYFAQVLVKEGVTNLTKKQKDEGIRRSLIELDNKVVAIRYLSRACKKQAKIVINKEKSKNSVYDYKPYQIFLILCESYLEAFHSVYDLIRKIDQLLGDNFSKNIEKKEWFRVDMDLRNVFHHNQSPTLSVDKNHIYFLFDRLPKYPRYLKDNMRNKSGRFEFSIDCDDLGDDILSFLQKWAKHYIDKINENKTIDTITGHYKNGKLKIKKMTLKQMKNILL